MAHIEHQLKNCPCGAKTHKQKTVNKWNRLYYIHTKAATNGIKKSNRIRKGNKLKTSIVNIGGEYKDRNKEW